MIKRLTRHGNSLALVIDRGVLDLLDIDAETPLSLTTDGKCLVVSPVRDPKHQVKFRTALAKVNKRYGRALKRLADWRLTPFFLNIEELLEIHRNQLERHGGRAGVRDMGLLQSALAMPQAGVLDRYFHSDLFEMAAAYLFHIVKNHPFVDGNKRVGAVATLVFLDMNGIDLELTNEDLYDVVMAVASGRLRKSGIAEFLRRRGKGL